MAHLEHGLGNIDFVVVQVPRQAFKVTQDLKARDPKSTRIDRAHRGFKALGMRDNIACTEHDLREASVTNGFEFRLERTGQRDGVHPKVLQDPPSAHARTHAGTLLAVLTNSKLTPDNHVRVKAPAS